MLLERLEMENFKSFRGRHEVVFGPRLNCITGANGSGKSNILEAICFAFGESSCARLRVANMKELHSKAPKTSGGAEETTTRVTLHLRTRQNEPMVLCATLCARTGHRTFKLNNRITPMKLVKRHLRLQCGINVDISLWLIQQNFVHKMASRTPVELAGYLCEAGGTKLFFEYREEAKAAMDNFNNSILTIQKNIHNLREVVLREASIVEAHQKHRENDRKIKVLNNERQQQEHQLTVSKIQRGRNQLNNLGVQEAEATSYLESVKSALTCLQQTATELQRSMSGEKEVQHEHDAVQLDLVRIRTEQEETASRIIRLQKHVQSNSQKQHLLLQELEKSAKQIKLTEASLCSANASVASVQNILQLVSTANNQGHSVSVMVDEITRRIREEKEEGIAQIAERLSRKHTELCRQMGEAENIRDTTIQEAAVVSCRVREARNVVEKLRAKTKGWSECRVESEMSALQTRLELCDEELRRSRLLLPKRHVPLQGEGDFGLLMDHIVMTGSSELNNEWIGALGLLLSKSLENRICSDKQVAKKILAANNNRHSFTVWPVNDLKLQPRKVDRHIRGIMKEHGSKHVMDPVDLISVSPSTHPDLSATVLQCLRKALGSWLLVKSDDIGRKILHKYGIPSVSTSLNMHSPGMLIGGYQRADPKFLAFTQLREVETRRADIVTAMSSLARTQSDLELLSTALRELSALEAKLNRYQVEIEETKTGIEDILRDRDQVEQEQSTLRDARVRKCAFERDMNTYLNMINEQGKIIDPMESTCFGRTLPLQQDKVRALNKQLTKLEIAHSSLQTSMTQLGDETAQVDNEIVRLNVAVRSLNDEEASAKDRELSLSQKLQVFAQFSERHKTTIESIHRSTDQIKQLEASVEQIVNRKNAVLEFLRVTEAELDSDGNEPIIGEPRSSLTIEQLEENLRQLDEQRDALTLAQKVLQAQLSSDHLIEETVLFKQRQLARFQDQHQKMKIAIQNLEDGIRSTQERSAHANSVAFRQVQRCLQDIFSRVVPSKHVELSTVGESIEAGVSLTVSGANGSSHNRLDKPTKELSGGQLAMLGMAYVFALARFSASPLYILDEVDAALDEHNQRVVADLVLEYFDRSQVICISHHEAFHARASQTIEVQKLETTSKVTSRKSRG